MVLWMIDDGGWTVGNVLLIWCLWESVSVKGNVSVGEGWGSLL
jgi:hypothetical protein